MTLKVGQILPHTGVTVTKSDNDGIITTMPEDGSEHLPIVTRHRTILEQLGVQEKCGGIIYVAAGYREKERPRK